VSETGIKKGEITVPTGEEKQRREYTISHPPPEDGLTESESGGCVIRYRFVVKLA